VERAFDDRDLGAAANAVAAYGRIGVRAKLDVKPALCRVLTARRAAVRASALAAARLAGVRCDDGRERRLVADDPSAAVRRAAALLVRDVAANADDLRALTRCAAEEPNGATALACTRPRQGASSGAQRALVFVVPIGEARPTPQAPFALVRPDGLVRHGMADRRGAVYEIELADGPLELAVPAHFDD
jgi:hypothetical protein